MCASMIHTYIFLFVWIYTARYIDTSKCLYFYCRCTQWIQWDHLCIWPDLQWKDTYYGGAAHYIVIKFFK
jgi:hypothetical protein